MVCVLKNTQYYWCENYLSLFYFVDLLSRKNYIVQYLSYELMDEVGFKSQARVKLDLNKCPISVIFFKIDILSLVQVQFFPCLSKVIPSSKIPHCPRIQYCPWITEHILPVCAEVRAGLQFQSCEIKWKIPPIAQGYKIETPGLPQENFLCCIYSYIISLSI